MTLGGAFAAGLVAACGLAALGALARTGGPYRVGPWPGLTWRGAGFLLGCAALLAGIQLLLGSPERAWPEVSVMAIASAVPLVLATRVVHAPGAASAVCGAFLLPRSVVSLLDRSVEPPPLVLVGAVAFDCVLWVRRADLAVRRRRRRNREPRRPSAWRGALAGAAFALTFVLVEPAYAVLLGADPTAFNALDIAAAAAAAACACAAIGLASRSGQRTGSPPIPAPRR